MPLTGPNSFGTLTWLRNACARAYSVAAYSSLGSIEQNAIDDAIAHAIDRLTMDGQHQWVRGESGIITTAGYSTGTVDVTISSATITGNSTAWNTSSNLLARDVFNVSDGGFYRVTAIATDTSATITPAYSAATASAASYTTYRDQYALPSDLIRLISIREVDSERELEILSRTQWAQIWEGAYETGRPAYAFLCDAGDSVSSVGQYVQLYPIPDAVYGYQVLYDQLPTFPAAGGTAVPGAPIAMQAMVNGTLAALFLHDPERGPIYEAAYLRHVQTLRTQQDRTQRQRIFAHGQFRHLGTRMWPQNYPDTIGTSDGS